MRYWITFCLLFQMFTMPSAELRAAEDARIVVLLSDGSDVYREVADVFQARLNQENSLPLSIDVVRADTISPDAWHMDRMPQLVVTVGTRAAQWVADAGVPSPVMRLLIPRSAHEALQTKSINGVRRGGNVTAIYLDQPWDRQMDFIRRLLPDARDLDTILGPDSESAGAELRAAAASRALVPRLHVVNAPQDVGSMLTDIVEQTDVMLAVPDSMVMTPNSAKWLLYAAYQNDIPVIAFSKAFVNAGALGAVFTTPGQIGRHAAELAADAARNGEWTMGHSMYPKYFTVAINKAAARSLRLEVPDEAEVLRKMASPQ